MSEFAGPESLSKAVRYHTPTIPGLGKVRLRSITPAEFVEVEGLMSRAAFAINDNKSSLYKRLSREADSKLVSLMWVDQAGNLQVGDHTTLFDGVDLAVVTAIVKECKQHSGIDGSGISEAAKNSDATPGADS